MRGSYCILIHLSRDVRIKVGALGNRLFHKGVYAYVGSARGGLEARVGRHLRSSKKKRWHIDYLLSKAEVFSLVTVSSDDRSVECQISRALLACDGASALVPRFGSSDCKCAAHLIYFGDVALEIVAEDVARQVAMLQCIYPEMTRNADPRRPPRE
jgi:sugar fermentation stimulation protein A